MIGLISYLIDNILCFFTSNAEKIVDQSIGAPLLRGLCRQSRIANMNISVMLMLILNER